MRLEQESIMSGISAGPLPIDRQYMPFTLVVSLVLSLGIIGAPAVTATVIFGGFAVFAWYRFSVQETFLSWQEKIFFVFIAGAFALSKNFSVLHLTVRGLPLFVSEAVLFLLLSVVALPRFVSGTARSWRHPLFFMLLFYFFLGALNFFRGLPAHGVFALRDAAVVYYAAFYIVTVELFDSHNKFFVLLRALLVSSIIVLLVGISFYTPLYKSVPYITQTKVINLNFLYGIILIFLFSFYSIMGPKRKWALIFFLILFSLVIFMQARTTWVSLAVAFSFMFVVMRKELWKIIPRNVLIAILFFPLLIGTGYLVDKERIFTLGKEVVSIFRPDMDYRSSGNVRWRLLLWEQAINKGIREHPVIGAGYGADYNFMIHGRYIADVKGVGANSGIIPPHNGYIALFFKMGLTGLMLFVCINAVFFVSCLRFYCRCRDVFKNKFLLAVMASQIHLCVGAFFFEAIEVPQIGIFLWVLMGLGVAMMQFDYKDKNVGEGGFVGEKDS